MTKRYICEMAAPLVWYIHDTDFRDSQDKRANYIVAVLSAKDDLEGDPRDDADLRHQAETMTAALNGNPNPTRPA